MLLRLPRSLHYPITVTELLKRPSDNVNRDEPLFAYIYKTIVTEGSRDGSDTQVEKTFPTRFESSTEGELKSWMIAAGDVIAQPYGLNPQILPKYTNSFDRKDICEIKEPCPHDEQFAGMCTRCGKDMTQ